MDSRVSFFSWVCFAFKYRAKLDEIFHLSKSGNLEKWRMFQAKSLRNYHFMGYLLANLLLIPWTLSFPTPWSWFLPCTWRLVSTPCVWPGRLWERPPSGWPTVGKTDVENSLKWVKMLILKQWKMLLVPTWISGQDKFVGLKVCLVTWQRDVREDLIATKWFHGAEEHGVVVVPLHLVVDGHFQGSDRQRRQEITHAELNWPFGFEM